MPARLPASPAERAAITIGCVLLIAFGLTRLINGSTSAAHSGERVRLDPNTAAWYELLHVEGVGDTLARRIVDDRERHGPYASIDDLTRVRGIGEKSLAKMRPDLIISEQSHDTNAADAIP